MVVTHIVAIVKPVDCLDGTAIDKLEILFGFGFFCLVSCRAHALVYLHQFAWLFSFDLIVGLDLLFRLYLLIMVLLGSTFSLICLLIKWQVILIGWLLEQDVLWLTLRPV